MSERLPSGRYGCQADEISLSAVSVTCRCGEVIKGALYDFSLVANDRHIMLCKGCAENAAMLWNRFWTCRRCGRQVFYNANWPRRYCTEQCQRAARNSRRRAATERARSRVCVTCRRPFLSGRQDAVTCSPACRQKAYRKRVSEAAAKRALDAEMIRGWASALAGAS